MKSSKAEEQSAETRFREAFQRLKAGKPLLLESDAKISQNNVAKEAGCDPSALRKARYPALIREIRAYVELNAPTQPSAYRQRLASREKRAQFDDRIKELEAQRDAAQSKLASAHSRILDLSQEVQDLRSRLAELTPKVPRL